MSKTFNIADLHGRFDLLLMALREIDQRADFGDTIVFTGDYIDRGPESANILTTLIAGSAAYHGRGRGIEWICLKGNHEEMMETVATADTDHLKLSLGSWWIRNGGGQTLLSYGAPPKSNVLEALQHIPRAHLDWLKVLPLTYSDSRRVFVHAGLDHSLSLNEQQSETLLWKRNSETDERDFNHLHIVHGHDQFEDGPKLYAGRSNFDTFAWATGRLVIGVFDDLVPGGPVECIEIVGEPSPRYVKLP